MAQSIQIFVWATVLLLIHLSVQILRGGVRTVIAICEKAKLLIGDNAGISNSTIICHESITIGNNVQIGANNIIYDSDMHSVEYEDRIHVPDVKIKKAPVIIDDGAWICGHCIILKGVHIGKRSVVAAGSVVTSDIPDDELWGGNPCRFIRKINSQYASIKEKEEC